MILISLKQEDNAGCLSVFGNSVGPAGSAERPDRVWVAAKSTSSFVNSATQSVRPTAVELLASSMRMVPAHSAVRRRRIPAQAANTWRGSVPLVVLDEGFPSIGPCWTHGQDETQEDRRSILIRFSSFLALGLRPWLGISLRPYRVTPALRQ